MIKAEEARKVTKEAQEAIKKKQTLEEARLLKKLFEARMKDADTAVKAAMRRGESKCKIEWTLEEFPRGLRDRFESEIVEAGYGQAITPSDGGEGWEIVLTWEGAK